MSRYVIYPADNQISAGPGPFLPGITPPGSMNPNAGTPDQSFVLSVGGIGAVSATMQIVGSNDNTTWAPVGDPITASGTGVAVSTAQASQPYRHFGAYLTAISGTNAKAAMTMACA